MVGPVLPRLLALQQRVGGQEVEGLEVGLPLRVHPVTQDGGIVKVHLGEGVDGLLVPGAVGHGKEEGADDHRLVLQVGQLLVQGGVALGDGGAVHPLQMGGQPVPHLGEGHPVGGGEVGVPAQDGQALLEQVLPVGVVGSVDVRHGYDLLTSNKT